jgi:hypothetical protein
MLAEPELNALASVRLLEVADTLCVVIAPASVETCIDLNPVLQQERKRDCTHHEEGDAEPQHDAALKHAL